MIILLIIILVIGLDCYPLFKKTNKILFSKIVRYIKERKRKFEKSSIF